MNVDETLAMMRARPAERVWCEVFPHPEKSFDEAAIRAGLNPLGRAWVEVNSRDAGHILTGILHQNLAYRVAVMPHKRAAYLAQQFIETLGPYRLTCATNLTSDLNDSVFGWTPATDFVMDAGVVIIGEAATGVYWVADED